MRTEPALPISLRLACVAALAVAAGTIIRCLDAPGTGKWFTVAAALVMIGGAAFAIASRTAGLFALASASAAFAAAPALDIAPGWFFLVAFAAALPVLLSFRPVWRYDALASFTLFVGSVIAGSIGAWWVREYGFAILHWIVTLT
jgi:hypothetical protein